MDVLFKKAIDVKYLRFTTGVETLEKGIYYTICASLENPLLTTIITITAGAILLGMISVLIVVFAGVICLMCIILLIEGFLLVAIVATFALLTIICSYVYIVGLSLLRQKIE